MASFAVRSGKARFFHRTVNSNVRGFTASLHLGYFLAVGSFMVLINLRKRIYCQKQESLCVFLVVASNRVSESEVLFARSVNTHDSYSSFKGPSGFFL